MSLKSASRSESQLADVIASTAAGENAEQEILNLLIARAAGRRKEIAMLPQSFQGGIGGEI